MSETYDFDEQLQFGLEWEAHATERLKELLLSVNAKNISYKKKPAVQRAGIDSIFESDSAEVDIKTQSYKHTDTGNLPIEIWSVVEEAEPGWFYKSDADLVVWVYPNKAETNFYKTGYLMPLNGSIIEWFNDQHDQYHRVAVETDGRYGEYTTIIRLVPIDDFPEEYLVPFDPRVPTDKETPQSDICEWVT